MIKAILLVLAIGTVSFLHLKKVVSTQASIIIKKDVAVYLGIMSLTCIIAVLMIMGMKLPSPVLPLEMVFEQIGKALLKK